MTEQEWLQSLKTGDEVFISSSGGARGNRIATVAKVTATQVVIREGRSESRYQRKTGRVIGGDRYYHSWLVQPSDDRREEIEVRTLQAKARQIISKLSPPATKAELTSFIGVLEGLVPKG